MLHIAVVEDDKNYAAQLREYLERYENETKRKLSVSVFSDGEDIEEKDEVCHDPDEGRKGASGCISALLCRGERSRLIYHTVDGDIEAKGTMKDAEEILAGVFSAVYDGVCFADPGLYLYML